MALKTPLANYNGTISEIKAGDSFSIAGSVITGNIQIDFGLGAGTNFATIPVTTIPSILSTSTISLSISGQDSTTSHTSYEHIIANMQVDLASSNVIAGTGFTINAVTNLRITGKFVIRYIIFI